MCIVEDAAAGSFINTPALHSNYAVFNDVRDANAVSPADFVKLIYKSSSFHFFSVKRNWNSLFKFNFNVFRLVRRFFRSYRYGKHLFILRLA